MEKEFQLVNYGVKPLKTRSIVEIEQNAPDSQAVLLINQTTAVFSKGNSLYKKPIDGEEAEKVFSRSTGTSPRIATCDSVIALYNREGKIRLIDYDGNSLSFIDTGSSAIRAVSFLSNDAICVGGESCRLQVYSTYDSTRLFETTFPEYIDSITSNGKYLAISLASGEMHIYSYFFSHTGETGIASRKKVKLMVHEITALHMEKPCLLQFLSGNSLFIGLCTGAGYVYSVSDGNITSYSAMHSKGFTKAEVHSEYLMTASLDGRIRISTHSLREVSSLYAGSAIQSFSALFSTSAETQQITGAQYLIATATGNVLVYRDRWTPEPAQPEIIIQKSGPQSIKEYSQYDATETHSVPMKMDGGARRGKYERLIFGFQYRKALSAAVKTGKVEHITSIMEYLHKVDRLISSIAYLLDEEISVIAGICIDLLRNKEFFDLAVSVLMYCGNILYGRETAYNSSIYEIVDRAVQESEEELLTQSALIETSEYIKGLLAAEK
ncbi:hypothetical protein NEMIN01_0924 [Nematocida minor]|uniref:uncharacterized protein n=1 Tax=Nematocida minor TaxID=1912983 RepID=UPI00221F2C10|nr:uncharacterized protein NEMIN01_0924 [Nematocida minor]KAI5190225.1 hypothetical protein NEMIN01_0924 [Nematocida minor]